VVIAGDGGNAENAGVLFCLLASDESFSCFATTGGSRRYEGRSLK